MSFRFSSAHLFIAVAPLFFVLAQLLYPGSSAAALGLLVWMLMWWLATSIPLGLTGLLPLLLAPFFFRDLKYTDVMAVYFSDIQRLFFGGFVLALALERRRVLEQVLFRIFRGQTNISGVKLILIAILITYFLSFWISNTAAALIMIGFVTQSLSRCPQLLIPGLFGVGYAASLGGLATLIGSPPNGIAAQYLNSQYAAEIHFANWMKFGVPISLCGLVLLLGILFFYFRKQLTTNTQVHLAREEFQWTKLDSFLMTVFALMLFFWLFQGVFKFYQDWHVAVMGAFILLASPLLKFKDLKDIEWNILGLFGGGLALALCLQHSGVFSEVSLLWTSFQESTGASESLAFGGLILFSVFFTEISSNTAAAAIMVPLSTSMSSTWSISPIAVGLAVAFASSLSFMLPTATPPNALLFASRKIKLSEMIRLGLILNIVFSVFLWIWFRFIF